LRGAIGFYEQAVALDPEFVAAWIQLARAGALLCLVGTPVPALRARSRFAAERALALDPEGAEVYLALGDHERWVNKDSQRALENYIQGWRRAPGNAALLSATAVAEQGLGRWEAAINFLRQAERLDPRSVTSQRRLGFGYLWLRRYPEATAALERGLVTAPSNVTLLVYRAMTYLAQGDLAGARRSLAAAPSAVERTALVAYAATFGDLVWLLDAEQLRLLQRLTPMAFDDDQALWGLCLAQACALAGDLDRTAALADGARRAFDEQLRAMPGEPRRHLGRGLALAYLGRRQAALRAGERGVGLLPVAKDAYLGCYLEHQLARICILVGEHERAADLLEDLLRRPYHLSPRWLEIDPNFDPLRGNDRFRRLTSSSP